MLAARQGALESARVLIDGGAALNLTDPDGTSAMVTAIINGHYDVAALLVEQGADPNLAMPRAWRRSTRSWTCTRSR